jgi:hypothetical protein
MNMDVIQKIKKLNKSYLFTFVKVHYNNALSKKYKQHIYSVYNSDDRQVGHCVNLKLSKVNFEINELLKKECLETGSVNLHAYAKGKLMSFNDINLIKPMCLYKEINYNPFSCLGFYYKNTNIEIKKSRRLILNQSGFFVL